MTLDEIITSFEKAVDLFSNQYDPAKYQMEVILTLAKEIDGLKHSIAQLDTRTLGLMTFS